MKSRDDMRESGPKWHATGLNNALIFSATYQGVSHLPRALSYGIGHVGTWIAYRTMHDGTNALRENLRVVRPNATERELNALALLTYRTYAKDVIDFIRNVEATKSSLAPLIAELDSSRFAELLAKKRGVLAVGGHFGNWELGGIALRVLRDVPVTVIGRPEASPVVGKIRKKMRDSLGIDTLEIGHVVDTALRIRGILSQNGIVAMLLDRYLGRDKVEVTMFGRRTHFLRTPAMIALLGGTPMLPCFLERREDGRFVGLCGEPIWVDGTIDPEQAIQQATQSFATQLEARIRQRPHLWYQFYRYWEDEPGIENRGIGNREIEKRQS